MNKAQQAARLAEIMVRRQYDKKRQQLPNKFWNLPKYKKPFKLQLLKAHQYIKVYDYEIITAVLEKNTWIFSLNYPKLDNLLRIASDNKKAQDKKPKKVVLVDEKPEVKIQANKKSKFDE